MLDSVVLLKNLARTLSRATYIRIEDRNCLGVLDSLSVIWVL